MHAAMRYGTPSLMSLSKDGEVSCEVRPLRSPNQSLTSLDLAELHSRDQNCIRRLVTYPAISRKVKSVDQSVNYVGTNRRLYLLPPEWIAITCSERMQSNSCWKMNVFKNDTKISS